MRSLLATPALLLAAFAVAAQEPAPEAEPAAEPQMTAEQFEASLRYQSGKIELPGGIASLDVPASFRYLGPEDAERVLVQAWGNPEGTRALGMLFPADLSPLAPASWGVVIQYDEEGHVADEDADEIDYADLLKEMKEETAAANDTRRERGYETVELIGWAEPPHYDAAAKKLYWAKELKFGDNADHTLNYNIRVLGRQGVLVLNAVGGMSQLGAIKTPMQQVVGFANFNSGHTYADFNPDVDQMAAYGLGALVAGGLAAKTGLFAKLLALAIAFKKVLIVGAVGLAAGIGALFKRKKASA